MKTHEGMKKNQNMEQPDGKRLNQLSADLVCTGVEPVEGEAAHDAAHMAGVHLGSGRSSGLARSLGRLALPELAGFGCADAVRALGRRGLGAAARPRSLGGRVGGCTGIAVGSGELGDGGPRELVVALAELAVVWEEDAGVGVAVGAGEGHELVRGGSSGARAANLDLCAGWVELCATFVNGKVESDDFVADEVVSGGDVGGDRGSRFGSFHQVTLEPFVAVGLLTLLSDLEPLGFGRVELVAGRVTAARKVSERRASVMGPGIEIGGPPVEGELSSGLDRCDGASSERSGSTVESGVLGTLVGECALDLANGEVAFLPLVAGYSARQGRSALH